MDCLGVGKEWPPASIRGVTRAGRPGGSSRLILTPGERRCKRLSAAILQNRVAVSHRGAYTQLISRICPPSALSVSTQRQMPELQPASDAAFDHGLRRQAIVRAILTD